VVTSNAFVKACDKLEISYLDHVRTFIAGHIALLKAKGNHAVVSAAKRTLKEANRKTREIEVAVRQLDKTKNHFGTKTFAKKSTSPRRPTRSKTGRPTR
jgi:hypothetical protein